MCCSNAEIKLEGKGPWRLPEGDDDVELIFTPGHTNGHVALFYKPGRTLFSGDLWTYSAQLQRASLMRYRTHFKRKCL